MNQGDAWGYGFSSDSNPFTAEKEHPLATGKKAQWGPELVWKR
jgi:hypothetical protein